MWCCAYLPARQGFLLLPGAIDPASCARVHDAMWQELRAAVPRLDPDDPSTWYPFTDDETPFRRRSNSEFNNSHEGGDPRLELHGGRINLHNGCDELMLDTFFHPLSAIAKQLLGEGEVLIPNGAQQDGRATGTYYADGLSEATRAIHTASDPRWPVPNRTEVVSFDKDAGSVSTLIGQGTRGLYVNLPDRTRAAGGAPGHCSVTGGDWDGSAGIHTKQGGPPSGLHSDIGLSFPGRVMLRAVAFVGDCPPGSSGFVSTMFTHAWPLSARVVRLELHRDPPRAA